ncbi:unnamed protein product [Thlaspi arvense]|uniref:Transmembrane protein n=1 Tax=Thlaspi arvense TaxID=13288 RepID=A0AAU9RRR5_THLAR|nr:unnamed protein product [Thlaspi arvense]
MGMRQQNFCSRALRVCEPRLASVLRRTSKVPIRSSYLSAALITLLILTHTCRVISEPYILNFRARQREMNADWGPVVVAVGLFILLSPGLLFQLPARTRVIEFGNMYTSGISILVHSILYFCIYTILIVAIGIHIHAY